MADLLLVGLGSLVELGRLDLDPEQAAEAFAEGGGFVQVTLDASFFDPLPEDELITWGEGAA